MAAIKKPSSEKKPKATPNTNPFGLTTREIEIMICAWKCLDEVGKIDKELLATLTNLGNGASAGRSFRKIMATIKEAKVDPAPGTPGTPTPGGSGDGAAAAAAAVAAANPDSPSLLASDKKGKKKAGAGRKRVLNETEESPHHGSGNEEGVKNESDGAEERPRKIPRLVLGQPVVTLKKLEAAEGGGSEELEAGEA
ncbi:hypothetical protein KVR01_011836 [Diaporthe batatas]|uniref:uncharacterized protein n=1 Tax=Diaporthe batatas TaxID=748121 RepID=UPI001D048007|nr:uncharacterized protein KVR01_011836 [Diaporthe batatas]KAG8158075.1 hypothetical protein KVR01_011836 [Diaporthe batatas]